MNKSINPKSKKTKGSSSFWYSRFPWLEYNVEKDAAFCFCSSPNTSNSAAVAAFTTTGYRNWANALDKSKGFFKHEKSEVHTNSYSNWKTWQKVQEGSEKNIIQRLCPDREEIAVENREYLRYLCKYCICYGLQSAR